MTLKFNTKKHSPLSESEILWMIGSFTWVPIVASFLSLVISMIIAVVTAIAYGIVHFVFCGEIFDIGPQALNFIVRPLMGVSFIGSYVVAFMIWFVETEEKAVDKE